MCEHINYPGGVCAKYQLILHRHLISAIKMQANVEKSETCAVWPSQQKTSGHEKLQLRYMN